MMRSRCIAINSIVRLLGHQVDDGTLRHILLTVYQPNIILNASYMPVALPHIGSNSFTSLETPMMGPLCLFGFNRVLGLRLLQRVLDGIALYL